VSFQLLQVQTGRPYLNSSSASPGHSFNATATHRAHRDRTPGGVSADGGTDASTVDHVITSTARFANLRDHTVWLMKRAEWGGLRGSCDE